MKVTCFRRFAVVCVAVLLLNGIAMQSPAGAANAPDLEQIQKACRQRQKKFSSAQLAYTTDVKVSKFSQLSSDDKAIAMQDPAAAARLKNDFLRELREVNVTISGVRMKYDLTILQRLTPNNVPRSQRAFNGKIGVSYRGTVPEIDCPRGYVYPEKRCPAEDFDDLVPIVWAFGDWEHLLSNASKVRMLAASADTTIDSHPCVVLEYSKGGDATYSLWLDPCEDFVVRQYTTSINGRVLMQLDCRYAQSAEGCWAPAEWTITSDFDGSGPCVARSRVTACTINSAPGDDAYTIDFPPGTLVQVRLRDHLEDYAVRPDGSKEILKSDADFLKADGYSAVRKPIQPRRDYWIVATCLALMAVCGGLFYARRRRRARTS